MGITMQSFTQKGIVIRQIPDRKLQATEVNTPTKLKDGDYVFERVKICLTKPTFHNSIQITGLAEEVHIKAGQAHIIMCLPELKFASIELLEIGV